MVKCLSENKLISVSALIFLIVEIIFGILVQTVGGGVICFSSVVTAFLFSLYSFFVFSKNSEGAITFTALFFTACADLCLVILEPRQQLLSMFFFSAVQLLYFWRLCLQRKEKKEFFVHLSVRLAASLTGMLLAALVLGERTDALSLISLFYYANLIINIIYSVRYIRGSILLPIGLLCFILCDTLVGISEMSSLYFNFSEDSFLYRVTHTELDLIWFFYVPAQTMLALSPIENTFKRYLTKDCKNSFVSKSN